MIAAAACLPAHADLQLTTIRVASGLSNPLFVTAPPGDFQRVFILEQFSGTTGRVRLLNIPGGALNPAPYLSVSPIATGGEQGLLGLVFHPDFLKNGYFWVNYTDPTGATIIARYQANAPFDASATANADSATTVLSIPQPFANHNGGWMAFGPDGYLYVAMGDGGGNNGPSAQNIDTLLGKLLRIDVDGADDLPGNDDDDGVLGLALPPYTSPPDNPFAGSIAGRDEIWAMGLRNPWRNSFDRANGNLYIADVGQSENEEINFQPSNAVGLPIRNYGWPCMEGMLCTSASACTCNATSLTLPIQEYTHAAGACSITGGYVYRGCAIPALQGTYFYADFCSDQIFSFEYGGGGFAPAPANRTTELAPSGGLSILSITSFGEDAWGELYICDRAGEVFKIVSRNAPTQDCNNNGAQDGCDIASAATQDANGNGVPDECQQSAGDTNCDGRVSVADIGPFVLALLDPSGYAARFPTCDIGNGDLSGDGTVQDDDIIPFVELLTGG